MFTVAPVGTDEHCQPLKISGGRVLLWRCAVGDVCAGDAVPRPQRHAGAPLFPLLTLTPH